MFRSPNADDAVFFNELMGERKGCVVTNPLETEAYNQDWTVSKMICDIVVSLSEIEGISNQ